MMGYLLAPVIFHKMKAEVRLGLHSARAVGTSIESTCVMFHLKFDQIIQIQVHG